MGTTYALSVPIEEEYNLLMKFYECVYLKKELIVLDQHIGKGLFQFFIDLDFKGPEIENFEYLQKISSAIAGFVGKNFWSGLYKLKDNNELSISYNEENKPDYDTELCEWSCSGEGYHRLRTMACWNPSRINEIKDGGTIHKTGLHIYFIGRLRVNSFQACLIIENLIRFLSTKFPRNIEKGENDWIYILDKQPYDPSKGGMRIPGSAKISDCECLKKSNTNYNFNKMKDETEYFLQNNEILDYFRNQLLPTAQTKKDTKLKPPKKLLQLSDCNLCSGRRHLVSTGSYMPFAIYNGNGEIDKQVNWIIENPKYYILACNIRTNVIGIDEENMDNNFSIPDDFINQNSNLKNIYKISTKLLPTKSKKTFTPSMNENDLISIMKPGNFLDRSHQIFQAFVIEITNIDNFKDAYVDKVQLSKTNLKYFIVSIHKTSVNYHWCNIQNRLHNSGINYFLFFPNSIRLLCRSKKCENQKIEYNYITNLDEVLFPTIKETQKLNQITENVYGKTSISINTTNLQKINTKINDSSKKEEIDTINELENTDIKVENINIKVDNNDKKFLRLKELFRDYKLINSENCVYNSSNVESKKRNRTSHITQENINNYQHNEKKKKLN